MTFGATAALALALLFLLAGFLLFPVGIGFFRWNRAPGDRLWLATIVASISVASFLVVTALVLFPFTADNAVVSLICARHVIWAVSAAAVVWLFCETVHRIPVIPFTLLIIVLVARGVLWFTTNLVWAHEIGNRHEPVYGPLRNPLALLVILLSTGCVAIALARPSRSEFARRAVLIAFLPEVAIVLASLFTKGVAGEYLSTLALVPPVLILQFIFFRQFRRQYQRTGLIVLREKRLTQFGNTALESSVAPFDDAVELITDVLQTPACSYVAFDAQQQSLVIAERGDFTSHQLDMDVVAAPVEVAGKTVGELRAMLHRDSQDDAAFLSAVAFAVSSACARLDLEEALHRNLRQRGEDLERTVAIRTAELQRSNDDLHRFAYVASHDLQAPLRTIGGFFQFFLESLDQEVLSPDQLHQASMVTGGVARMQRLINDLLAYSRISADSQAPQPVAIPKLVGEVVEMLDADIRKVQATVTVNADVEVLIDPPRGRAILQNLIQNALDHRSPERDLAIGVSAQLLKDGWVEVTVTDNGKGVDPAFQDQIFDMFTQAERGSGTGIGLAIVKRIVDLNGGTLGVDSDGISGTTMKFTLPSPTLPNLVAPKTEPPPQ